MRTLKIDGGKMDSIIAEYNNMYQKMNLISEHHNNLFIFTLTSSGAILTFALKNDNPKIALVNLIILILLRCRVMSYRDEYYKILAYIRVKLEARMNIDSSSMEKLSHSKISNLHYFMYSILGFGTLLTSILLGDMNRQLWIITSCLFLFIILLDIYYYFFSKKLYNKYCNELTEKGNVK